MGREIMRKLGRKLSIIIDLLGILYFGLNVYKNKLLSKALVYFLQIKYASLNFYFIINILCLVKVKLPLLHQKDLIQASMSRKT